MTSKGGSGRRPTREELAKEFLAALRTAGCSTAIEVDLVKGTIAVPAVDAGMNIDQLYGELGAASAERRASGLAQAAQLLLHPPRMPETWEEARGQVLPWVKKQITLVAEDVRRQLGQGSPPTFVAAITPHVVFELGFPTPTATTTVPAETLQRWGVTPDEAFHAAGKNLEAKSEGDWLLGKEAPGVFVSPWRDGYDVCRLFLPRTFARVPLRGKPVALAPHPRLLLVAGADDEEGLFHLGLMAKRIVGTQKGLFVLRAMKMGADGESWEDFLPPPGHAAHESLRFVRAVEEVSDYDEHAALIRQLVAGKGGEPMALPRLLLLQSSLGAEVVTVTVWTAGKPCALPKADAILFQREAEILGYATWEEAARALPNELKELPGYPARFLAADFPEPWQMGDLDLKRWGGPAPT